VRYAAAATAARPAEREIGFVLKWKIVTAS